MAHEYQYQLFLSVLFQGLVQMPPGCVEWLATFSHKPFEHIFLLNTYQPYWTISSTKARNVPYGSLYSEHLARCMMVRYEWKTSVGMMNINMSSVYCLIKLTFFNLTRKFWINCCN